VTERKTKVILVECLTCRHEGMIHERDLRHRWSARTASAFGLFGAHSRRDAAVTSLIPASCKRKEAIVQLIQHTEISRQSSLFIKVR
jgi:hypothetical protein